MVRRSRRFPRRQIHVSIAASRRKRRSRKNMVNAPAPVILEGVSEVVPVGVLDAIRVQLAECIDKSPSCRLLIGVPSVNVKVYIVHPVVGMIYVDRLRSHIQISEPDRGFL